MKYLVVKAFLGFGDRLESLKMCVKYAQEYKLSIYVDWTDEIWSKEGEDFYKYFSLDMPTMKLEDIANLSVFPSYWQNKLTEKLSEDNWRIPTSAIGVLQGTYDADVIVVTCTGVRSIFADQTFFTNVFKIIDERVINEVKRRQKVYDLQNKWGIHLRGTDRASTLDYKINRITQLGVKLVANGFFNQKTVVVSDDEQYIQIWKQRWHDHPVLTNLVVGGTQGSHRTQTSISKDELNVSLLIDFLTLASCSRIFTTAHDSRFAREAGKMHSDIKRII